MKKEGNISKRTLHRCNNLNTLEKHLNFIPYKIPRLKIMFGQKNCKKHLFISPIICSYENA